jgi:hypothetical protein
MLLTSSTITHTKAVHTALIIAYLLLSRILDLVIYIYWEHRTGSGAEEQEPHGPWPYRSRRRWSLGGDDGRAEAVTLPFSC